MYIFGCCVNRRDNMKIFNRSNLLNSLFFFSIVLPSATQAATILNDKGKPATPILTGTGNFVVPTGKGWGVKVNNPQANGVETNNALSVSKKATIHQYGINYHGGAVMGATTATIPKIYIIWYGDWASTDSSVQLITFWAQHIGGSAYFKINTSYTNAAGKAILNAVKPPSTQFVLDPFSQGVNLSDSSILNIVAQAINSHQYPLDPNGIYFVLTSSSVTETSGFCTSYCGWHTSGLVNNVRVKYAFIGDPSTQCPTSCISFENQATSPNGVINADGMISVIAHELEEAVTDPNLNAWWNTQTGEENADQCAWTFGPEFTASNGSKYNMIISGKKFLIQQNWVNRIGNGHHGYCAKSL